MKLSFVKILFLTLCALVLTCGAAMAEAPVFTLDYETGYITQVSMEPETEALEIPDKVGGIKVRGIAAGVFDGYTYLKYIRMHADNLHSFANQSLDFRSVENLESIYVNTEITHAVLAKFRTNGAEVLQYIDPSNRTLTVEPISYENGMVKLRFSDISPVPGMINYRVTRTEQNSNTSVIFDSAAEGLVHFTISNGLVTFIDHSVEPGKVYTYEIKATNTFWYDNGPSYETSISIPAIEAEVKAPPKTGDSAYPVLWAALAMMSLIGMGMMRRRSA